MLFGVAAGTGGCGWCSGLNCVPLKCLTPSTSECDCIWKWGFKDVFLLKWAHLSGPNPVWLVSLKRKIWTHRGHQEYPGTEKRPREDTEKKLSPSQGGRNQTRWHLDLGLPASRTVRKYISLFETTQAVVLRYGSRSRLRQMAGFWRSLSNLVLPSAASEKQQSLPKRVLILLVFKEWLGRTTLPPTVLHPECGSLLGALGQCTDGPLLKCNIPCTRG